MPRTSSASSIGAERVAAKEAALRELLAAQARLNVRLQRDRDHRSRAYWQTLASRDVRRRNPLRMLAEGDSWFRYLEMPGVITRLDNLTGNRTVVLNYADSGDTAANVLSGGQLARIAAQWQVATDRGLPFEAFLISAGGNDLMGSGGPRPGMFASWLHDHRPGMTPRDVVNWTLLNATLDTLAERYRGLVMLRNAVSAGCQIFVNAYDFPEPDGRKACGVAGPWLLPALEARGVPPTLRYDVVREVLLAFRDCLQRVAAASHAFHVVATQGALTRRRVDWANEIHPSERGFRKQAEVFIAALRQVFPGRL